MTTIRQHIPSSVDADPAGSADFETVEELEAIPWVARWLRPPLAGRLSVSPGPGPLLMATLPDGSYWVVGYLSSDVDLPRWRREATP